MDTKVCKKCGRELPLSQFYLNCKASDGHKSKCIDCVKEEEHERYKAKSEDQEWLNKERERGREKYHRLNYKHSPSNNKTRKVNPLESTTAAALKRRGYDTNDKEAHHWNYNQPKSVFLLSRKTHHRIHQYITVNYDDGFCYTKNGERLDTIEKATEFFKTVLDSLGINEELTPIDYS